MPRCDVATVLAERYPGGCVFHPDCLVPFGAVFPGLASPTAAAALLRPDEVVTAAVEEAELLDEQLLALVAVSRPADVPAAVGWAGAGEEWDAVPRWIYTAEVARPTLSGRRRAIMRAATTRLVHGGVAGRRSTRRR